jgi:hypothetical protein
MSVTVPFRLHRQTRPDGGRAAPTAGVVDAEGGVPGGSLALGRLELRSAAAYLLLWTVVLFAVEVLVLWSSHTALLRLGVLESVSHAVATVLDEPVPDTGVLPALQLDALLPWLLAVAAGLAVLWLLTVLAIVLVHNGICAVTGGPRVHVR